MTQEKYAVLKVMQGEKELEVIPLRGQTVVLGRERSDIVLDDAEVSSSHCQIQIIGADYHLFDLHSTNGTFVNGQRIVKSRLSVGDRIRAGKTEFVFDFASEEMAAFDLDSRELDPARYALTEENGVASIDELFAAERRVYVKAMRIVAEVAYGDGTSETIESEGEIVIGRLSSVGKFAKDDELSRNHARIFIDDDANVWVEDLGSTNGVVVNGVKLTRPTKIGLNDVVKAGRSRLKIRVAPGVAYSSTELHFA